MKLAHGLTLFGTLTLLSAGAWLGCTSSTSTTPGTDGGTQPGTDGGTTTPDTGTTNNPDTGTTNHPDSGGSADGGGGQTCTAYCTAVMAACTGADQQYATTAECMNACSFFPAGTAADTSGFTLGCKIYHAGVAATTPSPHCWHAGPYGFGGCGTQAESFCALATGWCSAADGFDAGADGGPYASLADCTSAFANFASADAGTAFAAYSANGPAAGNTADCREYHLGAALNDTKGGAKQALHCTHVGVTSATCQ